VLHIIDNKNFALLINYIDFIEEEHFSYSHISYFNSNV